MISKTTKARLAKLRQFKTGSVEEFSQTQFRQNMLAIESALRDLSTNKFYFRDTFPGLSIANNTSEAIEFEDSDLRSDVNSCLIDRFTYQVKSPGFYAVKVNIPSFLGVDIGTSSFNIFVNDTLTKSAIIISKDQIGFFTLAFSIKIPIQLKVGDLVKFTISSAGASNSGTSTQGMLEIEQITSEV